VPYRRRQRGEEDAQHRVVAVFDLDRNTEDGLEVRKLALEGL
jgi:hypothetical protein